MFLHFAWPVRHSDFLSSLKSLIGIDDWFIASQAPQRSESFRWLFGAHFIEGCVVFIVKDADDHYAH